MGPGMAIALVLVSVALAFCMYLLLFGKKELAPGKSTEHISGIAPARRDDDKARAHKAEADLEKKKKELEEARVAQHALKDELKQLKKKLHDEKESHRSQDDLGKARAEVERQASIQLESTRAELAAALSELQRAKSEGEGRGRRQAAPVAAPVAQPVAAEPVVAAPPPQRVIRELSEADKEKIARAEATAAKERARASELERDYRSLKTKTDGQLRQLKSAQAEAKLSTDKFRAIEKRQNRLLLERDLMARAIKELEKRSGISAERIELTAEEAAASDQKIEAKQREELEAEAQMRAKLEAQAAAPNEVTTAGGQPVETSGSGTPPTASA